MLPIHMLKQHNAMIHEDIIVPRLVNTQTIEFSDWCSRMANGSTVTAADVAAVMQQIENKMIENLTLNAKIVCSPSGLTFRPKVSGSITQSQLKAKLQARLAADPTLDIDVNRTLTTSDLAISDCTVSIEVDLPKSWSSDFQKQATLKRVNKVSSETTEESDDSNSNNSSNGGSGSNTNGSNGTNGGDGNGANTNGSNGTNSGDGNGANTNDSNGTNGGDEGGGGFDQGSGE